MTPRSERSRNLYLHRCGLAEREWSASFSCIESIIGNELPSSARNHQAWRSNHQGPGHTQTDAILDRSRMEGSGGEHKR